MTQDRPQPKISIIIPCLNEENYVPKLLTDLTNQQGFGDFEVIVVDSNSTDNTVGVAKQFQDKLPLRVISLDQRGVSRARNAGAEIARGEWLFFFDADVRVGKDYLKQATAALDKHGADFGTTSISTRSWHPFDRVFFWFWNLGFRYNFWVEQYHMNGSTILVKQELHHKIGGFDQEMEIGEDIDYAQKLAELSGNGVFIPIKMYLSNRRLVARGRITALLMAYSWLFPLPQPLSRLVYRDYFLAKRPPRWRRITRIVLNIGLITAMILVIYLNFIE